MYKKTLYVQLMNLLVQICIAIFVALYLLLLECRFLIRGCGIIGNKYSVFSKYLEAGTQLLKPSESPE